MASFFLRIAWYCLLLLTALLLNFCHGSSNAFACPSSTNIDHLPLGDLHFLVVTDVHGWIAGQHARHEPTMDVDFGALVSLYERLQDCYRDKDWFLIFNGDFMDGTGLSTVPPQVLARLLQQVPFSVLNVGNHELYFNEVVDYMTTSGFIDSWQGNYLASNVDHITNAGIRKALGSRYTLLHAPNSNATILTFGFLYNFENHCNTTRVQKVEKALQEEWFLTALTTVHYDAIVVLAHMGAVDPLVYKIQAAIRQHSEVPIQFFTGHTHMRHYETLDAQAASLEAGKFMDTIGFASLTFPRNKHNNYYLAEQQPTFQHRFWNPNQLELATHVLQQQTQQADFSTRRGRRLTRQLQQTQQQLGLLEVVTHCAPQTYTLALPADNPNSLWWLYLTQVLPTTLLPQLQPNGNTPIFIQGTGSLRYSLFAPTVVVDDLIAVTPFQNPIVQVAAKLTAKQLNQVLHNVDVDGMSGKWGSVGLVNFGVAGERPSSDDDSRLFDLYTVVFHQTQVSQQVQQIQPDSPAPKPVHGIDKSQQLETTALWMEFVQTEWKCADDSWMQMSLVPHQTNREFPITTRFALAALSMLIVAMVSFSSRRPKEEERASLLRNENSGVADKTTYSSFESL